ncbi:MAG: DNA adenine methylase [Thermoguttaceae bacterium]|nr:DNA adenine methylase [Thermoguttaceae bacterium]MDW8039178.1 DNA adenine methylase [Thermoguttaceae bacterium]
MRKEVSGNFSETFVEEDPEYLSKQLITYLGNKRALLGPIGCAVMEVKRRLGKRQLRVFDAFSGSGVVSRFLKAHSSWLVSNDLEDYAAVIGRCFLRNRSTVDWLAVNYWVRELNRRVDTEEFPPGFIEELYAPKDENHITREDRVFYTRRNARRLDNYRRLLEEVPPDLKDLLLGPLLSEASIHANTAGVFKGFYKDRKTGIGQFGGTNQDALRRILGEIRLEAPLLSRFECEYLVLQQDANVAARQVKNLDLAYLDPPYNQHPYGSNYFMLNLLVRYERPEKISPVSGIPNNWRRSGYNVRSQALPLLDDLISHLDAPFVLISFNNEGFIPPAQMRSMLARHGHVDVIQTRYNAFRGSRSFQNRPIHVTEQLFLLQRR